MKRITLPIVVLMIMMHVMTTVAHAQDAAAQNVAQEVSRTSSDSSTLDLSEGDLFDDPENIGQDLYITLYQRLRSEGSNIAVTKTAGRRSLTKDEIFAIIPGSNIGDLLVREKITDAVTPELVSARRTQLLEELADEKDLADLQVFSEMEVETTELFANGDESDSGFDLIVDLDIIEQLLFNKGEPYLGSGSENDPNRGNEGRGAVVGVRQQAEQNGNNAANNRQNAGGNGAQAANGNNAQGQQAAELPEVSCAVSDSFNSAVERARASENQLDQNAQGQVPAGQGAQGAPASAALPLDLSSIPDKDLKPAKADKRNTILPCTDRFCITIEAKLKKESAFTVEDNCILCHIEKINDAFKKTVSKSLIPNKLTGNLFEGPKCKSFAFNVNSLAWNFVAIPQPILTPPNDTVIEKGDFIKNFTLFIEKNYGNPGRCDEDGSCKENPDQIAGPAADALARAGEGTTFADISGEINRAVQQKQVEVRKSLRDAQVKSRVEAQGSQFNILIEQIDTMNAYFKSFETLFSEIGNKDNPDSPCSQLTSKPTCS